MQRRIRFFFLMLCVSNLWSSCYIVRDAPIGQPFVVSYQVKNKTKKTNTQENILVASLKNRNDLPISQRNYLGIKLIKSPPVFDSLKAKISAANLHKELAYSGYFHNEIDYGVKYKSFHTRKGEDQTRVHLTFNIRLGDPYYVNAFVYHIKQESIMRIVKKEVLPSLQILPNEIFSVERVKKEIERIVGNAQDVGFVNLNEKHFDFLLDTLFIPVANSDSVVSSSPAKIKAGRHALRVHIFLRLPDTEDSAFVFKQYYLRKIFFIPDYSLSTQNTDTHPEYFQAYQRIYVHKDNRFIRPLVIDKLNAMTTDMIFSKKDYNATVKRFLQTNMWSLVRFTPETATDTLVNGRSYGRFDLLGKMTKNKKFNANAELGLSFNTTPRTILFTLPNRTLASNVRGSFTIKNLLRTGLQSQIIGQVGIETFLSFAPKLSILLSEYSIDWLNHLPWLTPFDILKNRKDIVKKTYFNISAGLTDRLNFYNLKHLSLTYAWNVSVPSRRMNISFRPIQMSLTQLTKQPSFVSEEARNPSLSHAFNQGLVAGIAFSVSKGFVYKNAPYDNSVINLVVEESGNTWGWPIRGVDNSLYQYLRTELTFLHYRKFYKSSLAYRALVGVGISFKSTDLTLPFFKQFFVGGPNSMRAWNATRLGLGSSPLITGLQFQDRYGDIKLETNLEYRFDIFNFNPVVLEGAVFTDIGNIWNRKLLPDDFLGSVFSFRHLYRDIAVAGGVGLRVGVSFLVLRVDVAMRLKDPIFSLDKQWVNMDNLRFRNIQIQIGLGYPF